jgi:PA domain
LYKEDGYDHLKALFGTLPNEGSITHPVYYADSDLCDSNVDTSLGYPSRPMSGGTMEPWPFPYILMVDRGGCTFVRKVRNAQRSGASGVIIANTICRCSDAACVAESDTPTCETSAPIMADDGSGSDITIPSFLMSKWDADQVIVQLKNDQPVQLEMAWFLPTPDDRVEYDLWTVPFDTVTKPFLQTFRPIAETLGNRAYFTPHMYIYDGVRTQCQTNNGKNQCLNLCTNEGRYCAADPDDDLEQGISGADVVKESLRRLCIWNLYGEHDGIGSVWWKYVEEFYARCSSPDVFWKEDCIADCYTYSGADGDLVHQCMTDTGGLERNVPNVLLDLELAAQTERGILILPAVLVNTVAIAGQLSSNTIFQTICAGYAAGMTPTICQQCSSCWDPTACVTRGGNCTGTLPEPAATTASPWPTPSPEPTARASDVSIILSVVHRGSAFCAL